MSWYTDSIRAKWNDEAVREAISEMIEGTAYEDGTEHLVPIEDAVFGERVECPHDCGSMLLVGAPSCWGCEQKVQWDGRVCTRVEEPV